jgi:hypothetical protein
LVNIWSKFSQRCCLTAHLLALLLLQYVSEAVAALAEVPLKNSDVPAAVEMAAALHARCGYIPAVGRASD